jgi:hypothetical protein
VGDWMPSCKMLSLGQPENALQAAQLPPMVDSTCNCEVRAQGDRVLCKKKGQVTPGVLCCGESL